MLGAKVVLPKSFRLPRRPPTTATAQREAASMANLSAGRFRRSMQEEVVRTLFSTRDVVELLCRRADLVIATVLVPGATAPTC
jgi:alanine dehydrogenase